MENHGNLYKCHVFCREAKSRLNAIYPQLTFFTVWCGGVCRHLEGNSVIQGRNRLYGKANRVNRETIGILRERFILYYTKKNNPE